MGRQWRRGRGRAVARRRGSACRRSYFGTIACGGGDTCRVTTGTALRRVRERERVRAGGRVVWFEFHACAHGSLTGRSQRSGRTYSSTRSALARVRERATGERALSSASRKQARTHAHTHARTRTHAYTQSFLRTSTCSRAHTSASAHTRLETPARRLPRRAAGTATPTRSTAAAGTRRASGGLAPDVLAGAVLWAHSVANAVLCLLAGGVRLCYSGLTRARAM